MINPVYSDPWFYLSAYAIAVKHGYAGTEEQWLQELTGYIPDGSIKEVKLDETLLLKTIKDYVTPEMFGAVGDGVTDDTAAIQNAVDSGFKYIFFTKSIYKCGTINVTSDITIDCNNAEFICTDTTYLFKVNGEVNENGIDVTTTKGLPIEAGDISGVAVVFANENTLQTRSTYRSGYITEFLNGKSLDPCPFDLTNVTVFPVTGISVNIKNIENVRFNSTVTTYAIHASYCVNSTFENIKCNNPMFSVITLYRCYNSQIKNSKLIVTKSTSILPYSYALSIMESTNTLVSNCYIYNGLWHAISTTGSTDSIYSYNTTIENCELYTGGSGVAYADHDNGILTTIKDSLVQGIIASAFSMIRNCKIKPLIGDNHNCLLEYHGTKLANPLCCIEDVYFEEYASTTFCAIYAAIDTEVVGDTYNANAIIKNVKNSTAHKFVYSKIGTNGTILHGKIYIENSALEVRNLISDVLIIEGMELQNNGDICNIGTTAEECRIGITRISNSFIGEIYTTGGRAYLTNCDSNGNNIKTNTTDIFLNNCRATVPNAQWQAGHIQGVGVLRGPYTILTNFYTINGSCYKYEPNTTGYTVTQM